MNPTPTRAADLSRRDEIRRELAAIERQRQLLQQQVTDLCGGFSSGRPATFTYPEIAGMSPVQFPRPQTLTDVSDRQEQLNLSAGRLNAELSAINARLAAAAEPTT